MQIPGQLIHPTAVYTESELVQMLGVCKTNIQYEVRMHRLRAVRVSRVKLFLGESVLEWLRSKENKFETEEAGR